MSPRSEREHAMEHIEELLHAVVGKYLHRGRPPLAPDTTVGQLECLRAVGRLGSPSMSELAAEMRLQPSTVTGIVSSLIERGRLERREDPDDRRVVRVALTPVGAQEHEDHARQRRQRLFLLLGHVSDTELGAIREALALLERAARRATEETANDER